MPLKDDGLYRGDGAFEVIRLYDGQAVRARRPPRPARALRRRDRARVRPRRAGARDRGAAGRAGDADGQLRLIVTRGGRRIAVTEPMPAHAETCASPPSPTARRVILNGVKSLSYAANMQATRLAKAQGADEAVLVQPDGTVLEPPTSSIFWVSPQGGAAHPGARRRRARVDHPRPPGQGARRRGGRLAGRRPARRQRGLPRLDHARDPGRRRDRRQRAARGARPPHPRGAGGLRRDPRPRASNDDTRKQG